MNPEATLAELACSHVGAAPVFQRRGLDYACRGRQSLREACAALALDPAQIAAEIDPAPPAVDWRRRPLSALVHHILEAFHDAHRRDFPRLERLLGALERREPGDAVRRSLARWLRELRDELEPHMQKEEKILFPLFLSPAHARAAAPARVMVAEHEAAVRFLRKMREATGGFLPPEPVDPLVAEAYQGLFDLERDVLEHTHLENNVLAPLSLAGA